MADNFKWIAAITAIILGIIFILEPALVSLFPPILHYIAGIILIGLGGFGVYTLVK